MVNKFSKLGIPVILLVFGMFLTGCATLTWNSPVTETGSTSAMETALKNAGAKEIANYTVILKIFKLGKPSFEGLVVAAARNGKSVHILQTSGIFTNKIIAYATDSNSGSGNSGGQQQQQTNVIIVPGSN